jgi:hypothetical protein
MLTHAQGPLAYLSSRGTTNRVSGAVPGEVSAHRYVRLQFRKRSGRDICGCAQTELSRRSEQEQTLHQAGVVSNEHRLVDLVGKGLDPGEECFAPGRVEGHLDPHVWLAERREHSLQRLPRAHRTGTDH